MEKNNSLKQDILRALSYVLVAAVASMLTLFLAPSGENQKLAQIRWLIDNYYIGEYTEEDLYDGAAHGMVAGTGDQWSYYIPASEYASYVEQMQNAYVGIGVTITQPEDAEGFLIQKVEPNGGAYEAGILAGDIIIRVEDQDAKQLGTDGAAILIKGAEGSQVSVTVLRGEEELTFSVTRKLVQVEVARGELLPGGIGLVTIANFDDRCSQETLAAIESLRQQGAKALLFDVRFNPGGYRHELEAVLDYLLPEGTIFHAVSYNGEEDKTMSDAECLEMPMAVLVNEDSYSAAEFFAAALQEYGWAKVVGTPTTGKGYFQSTFDLSDGSAVNLSIGKYFTPVKGISLAEVGGLQPDLIEKVDEELYYKLYAGTVAPEADPQIQAAVKLLQEEIAP
jgi:carboxyl-terminal processing protease